jgi:mono/diheme cytochrome c family protein
MLALGFIALFLVVGLAVFFVAFRGGPKSAAQTEAERKRRMSPVLIVALTVVIVGLYNAGSQAEAAIGGVKLNSAQEHGREVFKERCATCHTLEDAGAVGMVGPDLDTLRPPSALILDAIANGRARGMGQMPEQLVTGPDARDVANYIATVAGR